jgi:hypothetical protein
LDDTLKWRETISKEENERKNFNEKNNTGFRSTGVVNKNEKSLRPKTGKINKTYGNLEVAK